MMNWPVPLRVLSKLSRNKLSKAIDHDACGWGESDCLWFRLEWVCVLRRMSPVSFSLAECSSAFRWPGGVCDIYRLLASHLFPDHSAVLCFFSKDEGQILRDLSARWIKLAFCFPLDVPVSPPENIPTGWPKEAEINKLLKLFLFLIKRRNKDTLKN